MREGKPHRSDAATLTVNDTAVPEATKVAGNRVILTIYAALVGLAGLFGFLIGIFLEDLEPVAMFGVIPVPPTPVGLAVYGAITIAVVLGVFLGLVMVVSRRA